MKKITSEELIIKIKQHIQGEVCMGTFGLVELELTEYFDNETEQLRIKAKKYDELEKEIELSEKAHALAVSDRFELANENKQLKESLSAILKLEEYKDRFGRDDYYKMEQPECLGNANKLLTK